MNIMITIIRIEIFKSINFHFKFNYKIYKNRINSNFILIIYNIIMITIGKFFIVDIIKIKQENNN